MQGIFSLAMHFLMPYITSDAFLLFSYIPFCTPHSISPTTSFLFWITFDGYLQMQDLVHGKVPLHEWVVSLVEKGKVTSFEHTWLITFVCKQGRSAVL
jgi:hypothetical protein